MATAHFDVRIRLLACEHCGAPLEVGEGGGQVRCGYCEAVHLVESRPTSPGRDTAGASLSEAERLTRLKAQAGELIVPPAPVRRLLLGSRLPEARVPDALALYATCRKTLQGSADPESERALFCLSIAFSNHYMTRGDPARARALVEGSLERLRNPRFRHTLYGQLARLAARAGELEAAQAWAENLDPRSTDLFADTAYRLTHALLATHAGRFDRVFDLLGERVDDVPVATPSFESAALLRAHALERARGVTPAAEDLARAAATRIGGWIRLKRTYRGLSASGLALCPESFDAAAALVPFTRRTWWTVPLVAALVLLAFLAPLGWATAGQLSGSGSRLGLAGPILFLIVAGVGLPFVVKLFRVWAPVSEDDPVSG